jgi:hypothetical protein
LARKKIEILKAKELVCVLLQLFYVPGVEVCERGVQTGFDYTGVGI